MHSLSPPTVRPFQVIKPPLLKAGFELVQREKLEVGRLNDVPSIEALCSPLPITGTPPYAYLISQPVHMTFPPWQVTDDVSIIGGAVFIRFPEQRP